jgi:hypothetical protein
MWSQDWWGRKKKEKLSMGHSTVMKNFDWRAINQIIIR